jgi:hypothetical protein
MSSLTVLTPLSRELRGFGFLVWQIAELVLWIALASAFAAMCGILPVVAAVAFGG